METGLEEIYLHKSYFKGVFTEVECLGHTNNTGDNGAGKTTLLSLIPVFYGMEPSRVVDRSAGKLSFVNHYLPSNKSMIVFEYLKNGQKKCAVLYRSKENVAYRFVDGSARENLFNQTNLDALKDCENIQQWLKDIVALSCEVSKKISVSRDYRAIIQNDKQRLRKSTKNQTSLIAIAHRFSLCPDDSQMRHIESLASVLMRHDKLLAQFKTMVVDSFLTEQIEIGDAPYHKEDGEFISSLQILIELDKHDDKFNESVLHYEALKEAWGFLLAYKKRLEADVVVLQNSHELTQNQFLEKGTVLKNKKSEHRSVLKELSEKCNEANNNRDSKQRSIDAIYDAREKWDVSEDISSKLAAYNQLDTLRIKAEKDFKHHISLLENAKSEQQAHDSKVDRLEKEAKEQELSISKNIRNLTEEVHQLELKTHREEQLRYQKHSKEVADLREGRDVIAKSLVGDIHQLKLELQSAERYTSEEENELNKLTSKIDELKAFVINDLLNKKGRAELALSEARKERDRLLDVNSEKSKELERKKIQKADVTLQLMPEDGSLRHFLNVNIENWQYGIGKVIRPDLLNSSVLSPCLSDVSDSSFFGVNIDLEKIQLPKEVRPNELLAQEREELSRDIESIKAAINSTKKKISEQLDIVGTLQIELDEIEREITRNKSEIEQYELLKQNTEQRFGKRISERVNDVNSRLESAEIKLSTFEKDTERLIQEVEGKYQESLIVYKANAGAEKDSIDESIKALNSSVDTIYADLKSHLIELNEVYESILKDKDIDPKTISKAKERRDSSQAKYEEVKGYAKLIVEYKQWETAHWQHIDSYEDELVVLSDISERLAKKLTEQKTKYQKEIDDLQTELDLIQERLDELELKVKTISKVVEDLNTHVDFIPLNHQPIHLEENIPVEVIVAQSEENLRTIRALRQKIVRAVKQVDTILQSTGSVNNKVLALWKNLIEERRNRSQFQFQSEDFYIEAIVDVKRLIEVLIPDIKSVIIEATITVGQRYIRFYDALDGLKSKVKSVSKTLVKEINTSNNFPALSDIKVELVSKVDEFDIWKELTSFNKTWNHWGEIGREKLPDLEFVSSFSSVIDELKQSKIDSTIESLVDIDISMNENSRAVSIRNDADLKRISSTGISKLAVIVVFCGMTRFLCKDKSVKIHWPLDELGELSDENTMLLFEFMDNNNISLFCAQPNPSVTLLKYFSTKNHVDKKLGIKKYIARKSSRKNPLLENPVVEKKGELHV